MSQHDGVIDNGSGLTVRTDINAALAALFSTSSGPVEPAVRQAGQFWFDIANAAAPTVRVRNGANTAWVPMITLDNINLGFGRRASPNRWVWNTAADLSGSDVMTLAATGLLTLGLAGITAAGTVTGTSIASTNGTFVGAGGATMTLTASGLTLPSGSDLTMDTIRLASTTASSNTSTAHAYQSGLTTGANIRIDTNSIRTVNNGVSGGLLSIPNGVTLGVALPVASGGTGAITAAAALTALGGVPTTRQIIAGNGLVTGGALSGDVTIAVGTPVSITASSTNSVTADGHSHDLAMTVAEVYTGSDANLTNYPIGTVLNIDNDSNAGIDRNEADVIYLYGATAFALSGTTALSGTWRSRGFVGGSGEDHYTFQRTA